MSVEAVYGDGARILDERRRLAKYGEFVSPFIQTKALLHRARIERLMAGEIPPPVTCELDLADGFCNHACPHCFHGTNHKRSPVFLDTSAAKELVSALAAAGTLGLELVGGGEPTTHPAFEAVVEYACSTSLDVGLVTNGSLLHHHFGALQKLKFVRVSVDAASEQTYLVTHMRRGFSKIVSNIEQLVAAGHRDVGFGFLIVPSNVEDIPRAAQIAADAGCRYIQYRPATLPNPVSPEMWNRARRLVAETAAAWSGDAFQVFDAGVKWFHLTGPRHYPACVTAPLVAVVKATGDIAHCILRRNEPERYVGNVYDGGFFAHWGGERHRRNLREIPLSSCPKPCKHDAYNIMAHAMATDMHHVNFV